MEMMVFALGGSQSNFEVLDCVGDWNVMTQEVDGRWLVLLMLQKIIHLLEKLEVAVGNDGYWEFSAGDEDDSEWVVLDQNDWTNLGSHPHNFQLDDIQVVLI